MGIISRHLIKINSSFKIKISSRQMVNNRKVFYYLNWYYSELYIINNLGVFLNTF